MNDDWMKELHKKRLQYKNKLMQNIFKLIKLYLS